jgi:hypothetical protein
VRRERLPSGGFISNYATSYTTLPNVEAVVAAAPLLQVLAAEFAVWTWEDASRMLHGEPPFAALQLRRSLFVRFANQVGLVGGVERFGPFAAALADATLQPALSRLCVQQADTAQPALMGALVDAAVARRLRELTLQSCTAPAAAPLARLLTEGSASSPGLARQFCDSTRANSCAAVRCSWCCAGGGRTAREHDAHDADPGLRALVCRHPREGSKLN